MFAVRIVETIASAEGVDPTQLDFVLEDYIDVEAIERLARRDQSDWRLSFSVAGRTVVVDSSKSIELV